MIVINKQLQRPDKGMVSTGSIINYTARFLEENLTVVFDLTHWFSEAAKTEGGWLPINRITNFSYIQMKECTAEEWALLDDAGSVALVEGWLKEIIDEKIGTGFTEIV